MQSSSREMVLRYTAKAVKYPISYLESSAEMGNCISYRRRGHRHVMELYESLVILTAVGFNNAQGVQSYGSLERR
jgi:hypothetical protein